MRRAAGILVVVGGTSLAFVGCLVLVYLLLRDGEEHAPGFVYSSIADIAPPPAQSAFDPELWKRDPGARYGMLADLVERTELVGMPAGEVEALLGPLRWSLSEEPGASSYGYAIRPPFGSPTTTLVLDLDGQDRVVRVRLDRGTVPGRSADAPQTPDDEP